METPNPYGRPQLSRREKMALTVAGVVVLAVAVGISAYMLKNRPRPERRKPAPSTLIVSVLELSPVATSVTVPAQGTVVPSMEVDLKSRVGGEVTWTHPEFVEGGIVKKGQSLVRIDPTEYELALTRARATLESALLDLKTEQGRQEIARSEWEILGLEERATEMDRELALRQPQLAAFEAKLEAAKADVRQAELNLERTVIRSPFNAVIVSADVDAGAQVSAQGTLARLAGSDAFYVEALIPVDRLEWIHIPEGSGDEGSAATVSTGSGRKMAGTVYKLLPDLQPTGRLARILVEIDDPLDLLRKSGDRRPLLLGDFVTLAIDGRSVKDVYVIPREHLKDGQMVYIADEQDRLRIHTVQIVWNGEDHVLARGVDPGARLIVSYVPAPVEGMELRIQGAEGSPDAQEKEKRGDGEKGN